MMPGVKLAIVLLILFVAVSSSGATNGDHFDHHQIVTVADDGAELRTDKGGKGRGSKPSGSSPSKPSYPSPSSPSYPSHYHPTYHRPSSSRGNSNDDSNCLYSDSYCSCSKGELRFTIFLPLPLPVRKD